MSWIDALGRMHGPAFDVATSPRIVSLVPSLTELLCELGLAPWVVGRTGFCIHPAPVVCDIPKVGGTKDVNLDKIRALAPTHLIVNIDENDKPVVDALAAFIPHVIVTHPLTVRDNLNLYRLLGGVFGRTEQAERLCIEFEAAYAELMASPKPATQIMLYCIWQDPWMTVGSATYIADMLRLVNWQVWRAADASERYPRFVWSKEVIGAIDGVLLSTEPYRFTKAHVDALERQTGKPVRLVDGEMMSWYGSRAILGLRYLRSISSNG